MRPALSILSLVILLSLYGLDLFAANPSAAGAQKAAQWLTSHSGATIVDLRTPQEFRAGHLQRAVNIDFKAKDFEEKIAKLDRNKSYFIHCAAGGRSAQAMKVFRALKFSKVYHFKGGYDAWAKAGLPIVK